MISSPFHTAIEQWLKHDTWHTGHASDDERFHEMLSVAEFEGPVRFDVAAFFDVVIELARRHHPEVQANDIAEHAQEKGLQAEAIMGYLAFRAR